METFLEKDYFFEIEIMDSFINYLLSEYNLPSEVVCNNVAFTYSTKNKIDKKSHVPITNHIVSVKIDSYDKHHNKLATNAERFINGKVNRPKTKKLINISPDELNNKFSQAKASICSQIQKNNADKVKELNDVINDLKQYCDNMSVIPNEFINEPTITKQEPVKNKQFEF